MSSKNWNRLIFYILGALTGGFIFGWVGGVLGR